MHILYPPIKTYAQHQLAVEKPHVLYIEESGNPEGIPLLVVHGGPGAGCNSHQRRFFDPDKYRIILFDQRGAGKSTPYAELKHNHTEALLQDIEAIRAYLHIDRWILFGSSWGGALSLLYAAKYTSHVRGLIIHGIFLARQQDIRWVYPHDEAHPFFPDYWEDFLQILSPDERNHPIHSYHQRLIGKDELARMAAIKNWSLWQTRCNTLYPGNKLTEILSESHFAASLAAIESYFLLNDCFIEENVILKQTHALKEVPGFIIHGRYDMICPIKSAWELHQAWSGSKLFIVREAGHSLFDPPIVDAIIVASQQIAQRPLEVG